MGRLFVVVGLLVAVAGATAGCSTSASKASLPVCSSGQPGHLIKTENGETYTTATAPCSSTTTTATTLPAAVPVGTSVALSYDEGMGLAASAHFTISRIWMNATPQFDVSGTSPPGTTFSSAVNRLLQDSHLPPGQQLMWVGVDLTMSNTGQTPIGLGETSGPGPPVIYFVVNGSGISTDTDIADLSSSGFEMGVSGCPFPFPSMGLLNPGVSVSGCVALAVPVGVEVSTVGFELQAVSGRPDQQVAQWSA